jgi:hypothetical protein
MLGSHIPAFCRKGFLCFLKSHPAGAGEEKNKDEEA